MSEKDVSFSKALVIETNNLRGGGADAARAAKSLQRLLEHLTQQTMSLAALDDLVITHDGLSQEQQKTLARSAGRVIHFVEHAPGTDYYEAKNAGFDATTADVVVFADSDCWPEARWLELLLEPFANPDTRVAAGRTTYRDDILGIAATTIDFMYFESLFGEGCTRNFYANNVAFRRETFAAHRFPHHPEIYRGPCQIVGLRLHEAGIAIHFVPAARTQHRFPDRTLELATLRFYRGQDAHAMAPFLAHHLLPGWLSWLGRVRPVSAMAVLAARLGFSLRALGRQDMRAVHGLELAMTVLAVVGLSALDAVGALGAGLGLSRRERARAHRAVLSYHDDRDRFVARSRLGVA